MAQQHDQQAQPVQNDQQVPPAQSKHTSGKTGVVRILSLALLVALLAIVALSFALCSRQGADSQIQARQTSSVQVEESSQSASVSALPAVADSAWDEETDDEAPTSEDGNNKASIDENENTEVSIDGDGNGGSSIDENGSYTSKDEVALYIHTYGHLPSNYISKTKARNAGWVAKEGNLDDVLPGMSIGGSEFYNNEGRLPDAAGRTWTECDINYEGGYRGAERIVFSNDGLIFYTADHYETFEQLY